MKNLFLISFVSMLFIGCQPSMTVSSDYDRTIEFSSYKTYQLLPWAEAARGIVEKNGQTAINEAIISELNTKGYTYVEKGGDLVVSPFVHIDEKMGTTAYTTTYGMGGYGYYGGFGYGSAQTTYNNYTYEVGSLILDIYDQREKKLIWQAVGSTEISEKSEKNQRQIPTYVRQVLHDYPNQGASKK